MANDSVTHTATRETALSPQQVFEVAANLELLRLWWFDDSPGELILPSVRVVRGSTLMAAPGVQVEVVSGPGTTTLFGRALKSEIPSVITFRCERATPPSMLRLLHSPVKGTFMKAKVATELSIEERGAGSRLVLGQEMRGAGRSPGKVLQRAVMHRAQFITEKTLKLLTEVAESH